LAISQVLPTRILIWLPTWPALAIAASLLPASASSARWSNITWLDEPAISSTVPIARPGAGTANRAETGAAFSKPRAPNWPSIGCSPSPAALMPSGSKDSLHSH
jgi:hypothetical protein